jgi:hypothetical protein
MNLSATIANGPREEARTPRSKSACDGRYDVECDRASHARRAAILGPAQALNRWPYRRYVGENGVNGTHHRRGVHRCGGEHGPTNIKRTQGGRRYERA